MRTYIFTYFSFDVKTLIRKSDTLIVDADNISLALAKSGLNIDDIQNVFSKELQKRFKIERDHSTRSLTFIEILPSYQQNKLDL